MSNRLSKDGTSEVKMIEIIQTFSLLFDLTMLIYKCMYTSPAMALSQAIRDATRDFIGGALQHCLRPRHHGSGPQIYLQALHSHCLPWSARSTGLDRLSKPTKKTASFAPEPNRWACLLRPSPCSFNLSKACAQNTSRDTISTAWQGLQQGKCVG
jgi:hypothetical protein